MPLLFKHRMQAVAPDVYRFPILICYMYVVICYSS